MNIQFRKDLDDIAMIAATLCNCQVGLITTAKEEKQVVISSYGISESNNLFHNSAFQELLTNTDAITIIDDLRQHSFSSDSSFNSSESPYIFYASCPILDPNGKCIGALSVWDVKQNKLSASQKKSLRAISMQVKNFLELENNPISNNLDFVNNNTNEFNKKLNLAQEIAKLAYWNWDFITNAAFWSDGVYAILGLEKTDTTPKYEDIENLIFPEDKEIIKAQRQVAIEFDQEFRTENRVIMPDGTIKWVLQIGRYTKDAAGNPISYEGTIQDITDTKLISLELEESIRRYGYVTKATSDAIWDLDFKKGKLHWGDNYKILFGHPSLDTAQDDLDYWESKIHPDDRERVMASFNACIAKGESNWQEEYRFVNVNNEYSNVIDKAFVIRNDKGEAIRMVGAIQDVTDKLQAFEELIRSNERFEKVADATNDAIWDWDLVNDVLYQGPGYFKLFGHKPLKGNSNLFSWQKFVHPEDIPIVMENAKRVQESNTETYFSIEYRYLKSDGSYANVIDRGRVIRNKKGEAIRMVGAMQDVSKNKMYEESLKRLNLDLEKKAFELSQNIKELELSEKRYIDLFHLSPQPMWVYDIDTLRFLDVNKSAIEHYGYLYDEFLAMTIEDIRTSEDLNSLMDVVNETKKERDRKYKGFFKHQKKNGQIITVEITSNLFSHNGKTVRIILANDITERLEYIKAVVEQNENLKEIAWVQSHVVRAPLARMMGIVNLLQNNTDQVTEDSDFLYTELLKSADELDVIIREISDKASKIEINSKKYDLGNFNS